MKVIMLAAGEGTRCYPFTYLSPKIFQQVGGIPLLEYMLAWFGGTPEITKLYVVVRDDSTIETLKNYIEKRNLYLANIVSVFKQLGYMVDYINKNFDIEPIKASGWGTGGDLRLAINQIKLVDQLDEDFIVCNADYVTITKLADGKLSPQLNLSDIISHHKSCKGALDTVMTVALVAIEKKDATRFGVAQLKQVKSINLLSGFVEKPDLNIKDASEKSLINAGVYVIDSDFILANIDEFLPCRPSTNLEKTLLERLANAEKPRLAAYILDCYAWFDVGTLEQLVQANVYIALRKGVG